MSSTIEKSIVEFTEKSVKEYLDSCIRYWRKQRDLFGEQNPHYSAKYRMARHYIDAFQSVRTSLFGELLPIEEEKTDVIK